MGPEQRSDFFYEGLWRSHSTTSWLNAPAMEQAIKHGVAKMPANMTPTPHVQALSNVRSLHRRASIVACALMWGSLTVEQVCAITSLDEKTVLRDTRALYRCGVLDVGNPAPVGPWSWSRRTLICPGLKNSAMKHVGQVSWPVYLSMTADRPWAKPSATARHNVLTTELALRCATWLNMRAVGENLSTVEDFIGRPTTQTKRADATLIRSDGGRIAIEMTASFSKSTTPYKLSSWAQILANNPQEKFMVLFVCAPPIDSNKTSMESQVRFAMRKACATYPGPLSNPTKNRMAVVSWEDWFDAHKEVSDDFFSLPALIDDKKVSLLNHPMRGQSRIDHESLNLLCGLPWWQRGSFTNPLNKLLDQFNIKLAEQSNFGPVSLSDALKVPVIRRCT